MTVSLSTGEVYDERKVNWKVSDLLRHFIVSRGRFSSTTGPASHAWISGGEIVAGTYVMVMLRNNHNNGKGSIWI
jgi:hypothetical protein